ncbi:bacterio-opsin activator domain-containing protein [Halopiger thermotolerans]
MSDGATATVGDVLRVLVVGDSRRIDRTADALAAAFDPAALVREPTVADALERLAETDVHCLVCEFRPDSDAPDASGRGRGDGTSWLERLAARTDAPIVAVTDGASADRALEAGATDIVETDDSTAVVATRVRNAAQRRRLETAGRDRDRRVRALLEGSDALVLAVDEDGAIAYASPAAESRLGYTTDELERTTLPRLVHPDDRGDVQELLSTVAAASFGSSERQTLRLGDAEGQWRLVELTCADRIAEPGVDALVVTVTAVGPVEPAGDGARAALDRLPEPAFALGPDWELQYANTAARRFFDGEPRPGTVVWSLLPESARETFSSRLREAATTGSVVRFEAAIDERRLAVLAAPDDDGLTVLIREIPSEEEAAGAAPAAEAEHSSRERDRLELLESTIDALEDGVAVLEDGTVALANAALLELADARTLVGREVDALFDEALAATVRERARSPIVRWMEPISGRLEPVGAAEESQTSDSETDRGAGRPVDVFVAPLPDDERERTVCVVRDRRRSGAAALSSVRDALAELARAETAGDVRRAAIDGLRAAADAEVAAWYRVDEDRLRPAAVTTREGRPAVELPSIDRDRGAFDDRAGTADDSDADPFDVDEPTVYDRSALEPALARSGIRAERALAVPVDDRAVVLATSTEPMAFEALNLDAPAALADAASIALDRLAERASVRDCRRDRARLESALARDERVRGCERDLLAAETREDVERRLCEGVLSLSPSLDADAGEGGRDADLGLAWVGRTAAGRETLTAATWAGRDGDFLESASLSLEGDADGDDPDDPAVRAATSREPTVVDDLEGADTDAVHREALERGFRAALSVPIEHDEFRYGTLTAYATRPAAFDEGLRAACTHLASVAGHAIGALERKRALLADSVAELEIVVRDESEPLSAIARGVGSRIDVRTVVPRSSGGSTVYCTIGGAEPAAIRTTLEGVSAVESFRVVGGDDGDDEDDETNGTDDRGGPDADRAPLEIRLSDSTVAETLAEYGGALRSIAPVDDRARLVIELSSTVDVRSFVRTIDRTHPGTELVARRERDRSAPPARPFDAELRDRLSERQLRTLEAAYYGGFFDWPRESTGEEIAETLGVSQPTFSRHLRLAQRKLFELLFDERGDDRNGDDRG